MQSEIIIVAVGSEQFYFVALYALQAWIYSVTD